MLARMLGAARLNVATFEDVESDKGATIQAMMVVVLVSIAIGIGGLVAGVNPIRDLVAGIIYGLVSWALWALGSFLVGTTILKTPQTHADWGELARTTGFAQTPGLLRVLLFVPAIGPVIVFAAFIWQVVAMTIAIRQALDYEKTLRAFGVVVIVFLVVQVPLVIFWGLVIGFGGAAPSN